MMPMISRVGLESKISLSDTGRKYPHTSYEKQNRVDIMSSDYEAIKRMKEERSVVKLLMESKSLQRDRKDVKDTELLSPEREE